MRILVVEDDPRMSSLIRRGLEEEGYAIDIANNGEECKALAENCPYDIFILDIILPGEDGFRVCQGLRGAGIKSPILMLTCKKDVSDKVKGLDCGADDYMSKPFSFEELYARVRALLRRQPEILQCVLKVGNLVLDTASKQVRTGQELLTLTSKEFSILELLMRHAGSVVNRSTIKEHVWNQSLDSGSNLVDVYIQRLRHKIGKEGTRIIQTVYGAGYKLVDL